VKELALPEGSLRWQNAIERLESHSVGPHGAEDTRAARSAAGRGDGTLPRRHPRRLTSAYAGDMRGAAGKATAGSCSA